MTAINVFLHPDAAYLMTDGIASTPNANMNRPFCKMAPLTHINAAISCRGQGFMTSNVASLVSIYCSSFDFAAENLGSILRSSLESLASHGLSDAAAQDAEVYLVGLSNNGEPAAFTVDSNDSRGNVPFKVRALSAGCSPVITRPSRGMDRVTACFGSEGGSPAAFDPRIDGVNLMAAQRREYPESVGGFCQLTTIRPGHITTEILHRWPEDFAEQPA